MRVSHPGFTLIEAMMAVAIFATALLGLMTAIRRSADTAARTERNAACMQFMSEKLVEYAYDLPKDFGDALQAPFGFTWNISEEPFEIEGASSGLTKVTIQGEFLNRPKANVYKLSRIVDRGNP